MGFECFEVDAVALIVVTRGEGLAEYPVGDGVAAVAYEESPVLLLEGELSPVTDGLAERIRDRLTCCGALSSSSVGCLAMEEFLDCWLALPSSLVSSASDW